MKNWKEKKCNMKKTPDRFRELLEEKYDMEVSDYFSLSEHDKNEIVDIVLGYYEVNLNIEPRMIHMYSSILKDSIKQAEMDEEFERCDIMKRTIKELKKRFGGKKKVS
jgi:hypothetical protein